MDPSHLAIRAARNGVGVILESSVLVAQEVSDGSLTPLLPHLSRPGVGHWIYTPSSHSLRPCVEAVREWLRAMVVDGAVHLGLWGFRGRKSVVWGKVV